MLGYMWTPKSTAAAGSEGRLKFRPRERAEVELVHRRLNAAYDVQLRRGEAPAEDTGGQLNALTWMLGLWDPNGTMRSPVTTGPPEAQPPDVFRVVEEMLAAEEILDRVEEAERQGRVPDLDPRTIVYVNGVGQALSWALGLSEVEFVFI